MQIAVIGTGMVGQALAAGFSARGHDVVVGTRDVSAALGRTGDGEIGTWAADHPGIPVASLADAVVGADVVVNATSGVASLDALAAIGAKALAGRVLLDVANPLDFSAGFPPTLFVAGTESLGERIQSAFPATWVVKSLNTLNADLMVDPAALAAGDHSVFVSGDNAEAKALVTGLLYDLGHTDVIDLGGIETARGTEMYLPLWLRLMGALGTATFNVKVVR